MLTIQIGNLLKTKDELKTLFYTLEYNKSRLCIVVFSSYNLKQHAVQIPQNG